MRLRLAPGLVLVVVLGLLTASSASAQAKTRRAKVTKIQTWDALWDASFARASTYYRIAAATTTKADPDCAGDLGISPLVRATVQAVAAGKHGDAVRNTAIFQSRTLCLTREGARGVEFALASFVHRALKVLPAEQQRIAVHGALNLGMLMFDQLQYSQRSYWLPMVKFNQAKLRATMSTYPEVELGLLTYDFDRGALVHAGAMGRALASMQSFENYGDGSCSMLEMSGKNFVCPRGASAGSSDKPGSSGAGAPADLPPGSFQCSLDAARSTGTRGMISCMGKAIAGMKVDPKATPQSLVSPLPGLHDPGCALSEGEEGGGVEPADPATQQSEPTKWDKVKDAVATAASAAKDIAISVFMAVFDKTPPVVSDLSPLASAEGADAERGAMQALQETNNLNKLAEDGDLEAYYKAREERVTTDPQAGNQRRVEGDDGPPGSNAGGACGRGSNAASRARALYECSGGASSTARLPKNPGPGGNPLVMRTTGEEGGKVSGAMACIAQAGDMTRSSPTDAKCAAMKCEQGYTCPCNGGAGGVVLGDGAPSKTPGAGPDCWEGDCPQVPGGMGGSLTSPKTSGGTVAPPPVLGGPGAPGSPKPPLGSPGTPLPTRRPL